MSLESPFHIAHIVDLRVVGGIERILVEFVSATPYVKHSLILFDKNIHPSHINALKNLSQIVGIYSAKHLFGIRLPKTMRVGRRAKLIAQTGANVVVNWSQVIDMRCISIPIVFYEHGSSWEKYSINQLKNCYQRVHHGIAVSVAAKRMLELNHNFSAHCDIVENTAFKPPIVSTKERIFPQTKIVIGAAGRLVERKNFAVLIAAIAQLRNRWDVRLQIAGVGPEQSQLLKQIEDLELQDVVVLLGYVNDMDSFYQSIDLFVNPSLWEAMPMVAIESFSAGIPIVGTTTDGLPEKVRHGINGLCIEPTWTAEQFEKNMLQKAYFANELSYHPALDTLVIQKSISVEDLVLTLDGLFSQPKLYQKMSASALDAAAEIRTLEQWVDVLLSSIKSACHA